MIEIDSVEKNFGSLRAVDRLSLTARDGSITGLIGPNGAGKTTVFRTVYGLLTPDAGTTRVDGIDVARDRLAALRTLGVLPDVRGLYPRLTGREHIRYFGELQGMQGEELDRRIDHLITRLGMADFADRRAKGYSRGQELKVALGRALVHRPRNMILDEPTNGLDVVSSRAVRDLLVELRDQGCCILISSHIMAEVTALCDYLVFVAAGRVVAEGTPEDLQRRTGSADIEGVYLTYCAQQDAMDEPIPGAMA